MTKETRWTLDVNRYSRWLHLRDITNNSIKGIEMCDRMLREIRNTWPTQSKIFDAMDRATP